MALESLSSTYDLLNHLLYNPLSTSPLKYLEPSFLSNNVVKSADVVAAAGATEKKRQTYSGSESIPWQLNTEVQGGKKRRKRQRVSKNKEEVETQRMTHIAVERNRRKMMNEHLAVLRSLMPQSYAQRGDQASIVGGAIEFLKELEHNLQTLEAQKHILLIQQARGGGTNNLSHSVSVSASASASATHNFLTSSTTATNLSLFVSFFTNPQYICSGYSNTQSKSSIADIEVNLIETHANVRILLSRRKVKQLSKIVTAFHSMYLTILHLNVTTLDPLMMVLYSISARVEEGCVLCSANEIASAVNDMLRTIVEDDHPHADATLCCA